MKATRYSFILSVAKAFGEQLPLYVRVQLESRAGSLVKQRTKSLTRSYSTSHCLNTRLRRMKDLWRIVTKMAIGQGLSGASKVNLATYACVIINLFLHNHQLSSNFLPCIENFLPNYRTRVSQGSSPTLLCHKAQV